MHHNNVLLWKLRVIRTLSLLVAMIVCPSAKGDIMIGVTVFRDLVRFDSSSPTNILSTTAVTGLTGQDAFESIAGIDYRPANGQLYALGNAPGNIYRLYTLNPISGVATQIGADINTITGTFMGFDFNPATDQLRIVTDSDINLRLNPNTGAVINADSNVTFALGDANNGADPNIVGLAYTNSTLFTIDSNLDVLTTLNPENSGQLHTVGSLGADFANQVGFDVSNSNVAFATSADFNDFATKLYGINLNTGASTFLGNVGNNLIINDFAIENAAVPEPTSIALIAVALGGFGLRSRLRRSRASGQSHPSRG